MPPVRLRLQPAVASANGSLTLGGRATARVGVEQTIGPQRFAGRTVGHPPTESTFERAVATRGGWYLVCSQVGGAFADHAQRHPTLVTWGVGSVAGVVIGHVALRYARNR